MSKRITNNRVKKWAVGSGIIGIPSVFLLFFLMSQLGAIEITGIQVDDICVGTYEEPCYAYINISVNEDVFIYPSDNWTQTAFPSDPQFKDVKLYRSWGKGWREIPLNKSCTGTWCGLSNSGDVRVFSYAFREGRDYQMRIKFIKSDPSQDIIWRINLWN